MADSKNMPTFAPAFNKKHYKVDPLAQSVEHNTFNVGVLGSSPKRITKNKKKVADFQRLLYFLLSYVLSDCLYTNITTHRL